MPDIVPLPPDYATWLAELKTRIYAAQQRAVLAVNRELVLLYWQIGRDILDRQERAGWGARVIDRLAQDLRSAFPDMKGFSPRNLKYMRAFAEAWPEVEFVQQVAAQLPWFHLCPLIDKLKTPDEREWYLAKAIEHGWSRNVLVIQIETRLRQRSGQAVTNFATRLPAPLSDLARESLKDPYRLDFWAWVRRRRSAPSKTPSSTTSPVSCSNLVPASPLSGAKSTSRWGERTFSSICSSTT